MSDLQDEEREALQPTEAEVEAAARSYWRDIDGMTPGTMPWDHLPEAARIEQSEHSRSALVAALAAREEPQKGAIVDELIGAGREDAERPDERMLDLLDDLVWGTSSPKYEPAKAMLRKHGRDGHGK
jgi:hypothetical protein